VIIKFFKGDDLIVGDNRGEKIKDLIHAGAEWIDVDGGMYKVSNISSILPSSGDVKMIGGVSKKHDLRDQLIAQEEAQRRLGQ
jgi:hypothetical protein